MLNNYFRIAWRNVIRHKAYAAINISGLAVGIAASLLLFTVIKYELSYDTYQPAYRLQDFSYRTDIHWGIYVIAGIITFLLTILTVSFQAIKAARSNPVK